MIPKLVILQDNVDMFWIIAYFDNFSKSLQDIYGESSNNGRHTVIDCCNTFCHSCIFTIHTPNANMADHSVIARDELHENEASEASVFCFDNASLKILLCGLSSLFYFAMPTSFCVL